MPVVRRFALSPRSALPFKHNLRTAVRAVMLHKPSCRYDTSATQVLPRDWTSQVYGTHSFQVIVKWFDVTSRPILCRGKKIYNIAVALYCGNSQPEFAAVVCE